MMRLMAMTSAAALLFIQATVVRAQDPPETRKETVQAFTLRVTGDGHVEMTVMDNGAEKTYKASSMEEFTRTYPDLARKVGIGQGGIRVWSFQQPRDFPKAMEDWRKQFGDFDFGLQDPELRKLLEHPEQLFPEHGAPHAAPKATPKGDGFPAATGPRLGLRLVPLSQVLSDQLGLDAQKAAQIDDVEAGSAAEKSGLQKNDVLLKIDGHEASGMDSLRTNVREALKKKDFDVDILRHGQKQTIKVQSPAQK
jgi:membrane-associated protease RseP (regulator of RpoE activity)